MGKEAGQEHSDLMRIYREGCDYWKSMPVSCRTMSAGRCDIALALIDKHAAEVKEADAKLQGYVQLLLKGRAENSREARIAGATYAKEKVKALAGFQGSPPCANGLANQERHTGCRSPEEGSQKRARHDVDCCNIASLDALREANLPG